LTVNAAKLVVDAPVVSFSELFKRDRRVSALLFALG
jgi:hypothetical protein